MEQSVSVVMSVAKYDSLTNPDTLEEKMKDPKVQEAKRLKKAKKKVTERRRKIFLKTLAKTGRVGYSARAAGYSCSTYLARIRRSDPDFSAQWDEALDTAMDILEDAAHERAVDGVEEPVFHQGAIVGHKLKYSDGLLTTLLKANNPDKYRDNTKLDVNVSGGFGIAVLPSTQKSAIEWEAKAAIVHRNQDELMDETADTIDAEFEEIKNTGMKRS